MSNSREDQNSSTGAEKKSTGGKTLSLKGVDPKALQRQQSGNGPLIEHKRRPSHSTQNQFNKTGQKSQNGEGQKKKFQKSDRYAGGNNSQGGTQGVRNNPNLSHKEMLARQNAQQRFNEEEQQRKKDAEAQIILDQKAREEYVAPPIEIAKEVPTQIDSSVNDVDKTKSNAGPKILGTLEPSQYVGKSRSHLAGGANQRTQGDSNNENRQTGGYNRRDSSQGNRRDDNSNRQERGRPNQGDRPEQRDGERSHHNNNQGNNNQGNNNQGNYQGRNYSQRSNFNPNANNGQQRQNSSGSQGGGGYRTNNANNGQGGGGFRTNNTNGQGGGGYRTNNANNAQGGGGYRTNNNSSSQGQRPTGNRDNNRDNRNTTGNSTASNFENKPRFSNQRTEFSSTPAPDVTAKVISRTGGAKNKTKQRSDEAYQDMAVTKKAAAEKDRHKKLTVVTAEGDVDEVRSRSVASYRRKLDKQKKSLHAEEKLKVYREVIIPDSLTVQELANRMSERSADVVKELMKLGIMATINKVIDADTAEIVVESLGHTSKRVSESDVENVTHIYEDSEDTLKHRAPVVTIMGHVDHGKTSLLDALRSANVVSGEAGGITQHIGAYQVRLDDKKRVTFIDTPGHAAFSEMRARGAKVTDIVILVVAADDGVMPQTIEAIKHAKAAEVPIIVAINKIDKPQADPQRIRTELLQHEIVVESMGGEVIDVEVSAKQKLNLEGLLESILLQAEVLELKANPERFAEGAVIEAELDKGRGPVATFLVQHGNLKIGDIVVAGAVWGRVRALINDLGERITEAGPSVPVEMLGLNGVPLAGDGFMVVENENRAREITEYRERKLKEKVNLATVKSLDSLMHQIKESSRKSMPVVVKGDVQGSVEAICAALAKLGNDEVKVQAVYSAVGGVTESDVNLAETAGGIVIGFNVRANKQARDLAEERGVEIRYYSIIYNLIDDVKAALSGMLSPELRENFLGNAEILEVFDITKVGKVAGCRIREGLAKRSAKVRLIRDNVVIHEGVLSTLRRFKDEVKEVQNGYECGMAFENYSDIRIGDTIEIFEIQEIQRQL